MSLFRYIFTKVSQYSVLLPIIAGIIHYKKLTPIFRILLYFFVYSLCTEIASSWTKELFGTTNNMPIARIFILVEFLVFSAVYLMHLQNSLPWKIIIIVNLIIGTAVAFADAFYINDIRSWPNVSWPYSAVSIVVYSLAYFYFLFRDQTLYSRIDPMFWVNSGAMVYFANSAYYFMQKSHLIHNDPEASTVGWYIHAVFNIVAYILYTKAFMCFRKQNPIQ